MIIGLTVGYFTIGTLSLIGAIWSDYDNDIPYQNYDSEDWVGTIVLGFFLWLPFHLVLLFRFLISTI